MECLLTTVIVILAGIILYQKWTAYVIHERKEVNLEIRMARRKREEANLK